MLPEMNLTDAEKDYIFDITMSLKTLANCYSYKDNKSYLYLDSMENYYASLLSLRDHSDNEKLISLIEKDLEQLDEELEEPCKGFFVKTSSFWS